MQPPDPITQYRFDQGARVGELARLRYPSGELIEAEYWDHERAMEQTRKTLADLKMPALYEAAFVAKRTRIRVDILVHKAADTWEMWEVKSTTSVKDVHVFDFAVQLAVVRGWVEENNIPMRIVRGGILHLNNQYVYQGDDYDTSALFMEAEILREAEALTEEVERAFLDGVRVVDSADPPAITPGPQCSDPYDCPFYGTVCEALPDDPLQLLPGVGEVRVKKWHGEGIHTLDDLKTSGIRLNEKQARALKAHLTGNRLVTDGLRETLEQIGYPRYHLDFESTGPFMALPLWSGTRPYQQVPFQFSLHAETSPDTSVLHDGYLHEGPSDPRRPLAEALLGMLRAVPGKVLMYSHYERRMLRDLAEYLPDLRSDLMALEERLVDLLSIVRDHIYDPAFKGSFSLKLVLPALVKGMSYEGLEIGDGATASLEYLRMAGLLQNPSPSDDDLAEVKRIRTALWLYCKQDTEAMVKLVAVLRRGPQI